MKHYILYYHGGSCNHGCEALVRTTSELLDYKENKITLCSFRPDDDRKYGIDKLCDIHRMSEKKPVSKWEHIKAYLQLKLKKNYYPLDDGPMLNAVDAKKGDIAISIGGDNYCYDFNDRMMQFNELWRRNGIKTVLWGCSIEPELLDDPDIAKDISRFDLVTARESISYEAIKKVNKNTVLVSDSAFLLASIEKPMPEGFEGADIVGLNLSPMAESYGEDQGLARKNYERLIEYILSETNFKILLIPHVVVDYGDDRLVHRDLFNKYKQSNRIQMIEDCNCMEIKGYIARCRFFVGARTHATIAAYSSGVPTLVLGYSVKSRGIAKDLFGSYEEYVVPVQSLKNEDDLLTAFCRIVSNENQISGILKNQMANYKNSVFRAVDFIKSL